jgi:tripartite-type tricarboxylate transporter receptor subunit TctC
MRLTRRATLAMLAAPAIARPAVTRAQPAWPAHPVRIVIAWPAGGSTDGLLRALQAPLQAVLGQAVVLENRAGASGSIGAAAVAQAAPDGYTLLSDASTQAVNPALLRGLAFDYLTAFAPITLVAQAPLLLTVRADSPAQDVPGLMAMLQAIPGGGTYSSSGIGAAAHLAAAMLLRQAGVAATHVPYRGSPPQVQAVLAGEVMFTCATVPALAGLVADGRLRALATTAGARLAGYPAVPTVAEQGFPGFAMTEWLAMLAPAGTPTLILNRVAEAIATALRDPAVQQRLPALGMAAAGDGPAALTSFLAEQRVRMAALIQAENIRLE